MSRLAVEIRQARPEDAQLLLDDIRPADYAELEASHGKHADFVAVVQRGIAISQPMVWSAFVDGKLWMLGGAAKGGTLLGGEYGVPWMLGTTAILNKGGVLTKVARAYLEQMKAAYPEMMNLVDARNTKAIAWLKRMGFEVDTDTIQAGPDRMDFHRFRMK